MADDIERLCVMCGCAADDHAPASGHAYSPDPPACEHVNSRPDLTAPERTICMDCRELLPHPFTKDPPDRFGKLALAIRHTLSRRQAAIMKLAHNNDFAAAAMKQSESRPLYSLHHFAQHLANRDEPDPLPSAVLDLLTELRHYVRDASYFEPREDGPREGPRLLGKIHEVLGLPPPEPIGHEDDDPD